MPKRKIEMYEYRTVIYRLQQSQSVRTIAKSGLAGRTKISEIKTLALTQGWLGIDAKLPDDKTLALFFETKKNEVEVKSKAEPYYDLIEKWALEDVQASTIHQHLIDIYGFTGAYNSVQRLVKKIKAKQPPNLTVPLHFQPGEAAQVDFGHGPVLYDERTKKEEKTWFFVMTLCWSRHQYAEIITHQDVETWLNCHQNAFNWFGGVVNKVIIDNPKCAIIKACYHSPEVQRSYEEFAQGYGFIINALPPRDPQKKGRVESGVKYVKKNFLPLRQLKSLQHGNKELSLWVTGLAGNRNHGSTFKKPLCQFQDIEKHQLKSLPATQPEVAIWVQLSLYRDCHVRYKKIKYSAPSELYKKDLWTKVTATTLSIYHEHELVAIHPRKFIPGDYSTKDEHLPANARFFFERNEDWCLTKSTEIGIACEQIIGDLLTDPVLDLLRQVQLIIKLKDSYGACRLELACQRAINFNSCNYQTIKKILKGGLDYEQINSSDSFEKLSEVYQGKGIYQRNLKELTH